MCFVRVPEVHNALCRAIPPGRPSEAKEGGPKSGPKECGSADEPIGNGLAGGF